MAGGKGITIRAAAARDASAIATIYAHHVQHGVASLEYDPPDVRFWDSKIDHLAARGWPFLVAEIDGGVVGYAYVAPFRERAGYSWTCENSIYIDAGHIRRGIGRALLLPLIDAAAAVGFHEMIAGISDGDASIPLHTALGFRQVGRLEGVGFKHGRTLDVVYMQRTLEQPT